MFKENFLEVNIEKLYTKELEPLLNKKAIQGINFIQDYLKESEKPFVPKNKIRKEIKNFSNLEFNLLLEYMKDYGYVLQDHHKGTGALKKASGYYADIIRGQKEINGRRNKERRKFLSKKSSLVSSPR